MNARQAAAIDRAIASGKDVVLLAPVATAAGVVSITPSASGAGVDYPAHWDTSPVDANATPEQAARPSASRPTADDSGAGTEYPAHWKR